MPDKILTSADMTFIRQNLDKMSMPEIAREIGVKPYYVYQYCYRQKLIKPRKYVRKKTPNLVERIVRFTQKKKIERPAPVYTQSRSPYEIADKLMEEYQFLNLGMSKRIIL